MDRECQIRIRLLDAYLCAQSKLDAVESGDDRQSNEPPIKSAAVLAREEFVSRRKDLVDYCREHGC